MNITVSASKNETETVMNTSPEEKHTSRGKRCFQSGKSYQTKICEKLQKLSINGAKCNVREVIGANSGADITIMGISNQDIGFEIKNKGAFEGGSSKMTYNEANGTLSFSDGTLHQKLLGNQTIYDGKNLPWYAGKKTMEDYKQVADIFGKEIRIELPTHSMADYYKHTSVHYIQVEGYGLYHTGTDILNFGVPYFECKQGLRIRTSKHKKKGIPTDVVGDINYDKKSLMKSPYNLEHTLPTIMKLEEE